MIGRCHVKSRMSGAGGSGFAESRWLLVEKLALVVVLAGLVSVMWHPEHVAASTRPVTAPACGEFAAFSTGAEQGLSWVARRVGRSESKFSPGDQLPVAVEVIEAPHPGWYSAPTGSAWVNHPSFGDGTQMDADGDGNINEGSIWGVPIVGSTGDWVAIEFSTSFVVGTEREASTVLSVDYSVDDEITDILINGVSQTLPASTSSQLKSVSLAGAWDVGLNTVTFVMESGPDWGAFLVTSASTSLTSDFDGDTVLDCDDDDTNTTPYEGLTGDEAEIVRLYSAALGRLPDAAGFSYWVDLAREGYDVGEIALDISVGPESQTRFGGLNDSDFVEALYTKILYRPSDAGGKAHWLAALDAGVRRSDVIRYFSESPEFLASHESITG